DACARDGGFAAAVEDFPGVDAFDAAHGGTGGNGPGGGAGLPETPAVVGAGGWRFQLPGGGEGPARARRGGRGGPLGGNASRRVSAAGRGGRGAGSKAGAPGAGRRN